MSLYSLFASKWSATEKPVIVFGDQSLTWAELDKRAMQAVSALEIATVQAGDVVALQMPKCIEFQAVILGCLARGVTVLPLNPQYTEDEVRFALTDSNARLAILASPCTHAPCEVWTLSTLSERLNSASLHNIQEAPPPPPESLAFLCYTSGTTGRPKGAMIRHQNIQHTLQALHNAWHWTESDTLLHVLPMFPSMDCSLLSSARYSQEPHQYGSTVLSRKPYWTNCER